MKAMRKRHATSLIVAGFSALTFHPGAKAQEFAPKQITVIVGFPAADSRSGSR